MTRETAARAPFWSTAAPSTSCLVLALDVDGGEVTTIEGLPARWHARSSDRPPSLHPVQQGFLEEGGAQCGFCTAGMVMAAAGLLETAPDPTEAEIRAGLEGNLCRCTGYVKIVPRGPGGRASACARPGRPGRERRSAVRGRRPPRRARPFRVIGTRVTKLDAMEKVTGSVQYLPDLDVPGMVWGKILRTPVPHARIARLDTSRAEALPGVLGVVTGRNVEQRAFGYAKDHLALKPDVVRCIRDEVAAVAAETEEIAAEACRLIDVEYEELPAVFDPEAALRPGAPQVHSRFPGNLGELRLQVHGRRRRSRLPRGGRAWSRGRTG